MKTIISYQASQAIQAGAKRHYQFRAVTEDDYRVGWVVERVKEAPVSVSKRLKTLEAAGIQVKEVLIAHEAPRLLSAPKPEPKVEPVKHEAPASIPDFSWLLVLGALALEIFVQVILIDPACFVILEDGSMIEVMTWYA